MRKRCNPDIANHNIFLTNVILMKVILQLKHKHEKLFIRRNHKYMHRLASKTTQRCMVMEKFFAPNREIQFRVHAI